MRQLGCQSVDKRRPYRFSLAIGPELLKNMRNSVCIGGLEDHLHVFIRLKKNCGRRFSTSFFAVFLALLS
jgi:hypothetical protein